MELMSRAPSSDAWLGWGPHWNARKTHALFQLEDTLRLLQTHPTIVMEKVLFCFIFCSSLVPSFSGLTKIYTLNCVITGKDNLISLCF